MVEDKVDRDLCLPVSQQDWEYPEPFPRLNDSLNPTVTCGRVGTQVWPVTLGSSKITHSTLCLLCFHLLVPHITTPLGTHMDTPVILWSSSHFLSFVSEKLKFHLQS